MDRHTFARPFSGVVQQVANEVGEILGLAAKLEAGLQLDVECQGPVAMQLLESADEPIDDRLDLSRRSEGPGAGGGAGAVEVEGHLPAHDLGLFAHLLRQAWTL